MGPGGASGSGGGQLPLLTHAYAEAAGTAFVPHPHQHIFHDEAAGCVHQVVGSHVTTTWLPGGVGQPHHLDMVAAEAPNAAAATAGEPPSVRFAFSSGAPVLLVRAQPAPAGAAAGPGGGAGDSPAEASAPAFEGLVALQRSARLIEFIDPISGNLFLESPAGDRHWRAASLRGFFWLPAPSPRFVMVTEQGLELCALQPGGQGLKLEGMQRLHDVRWYLYCHRTRMVLVGCGEGGTKLQAFQFTPTGAIKLPALNLSAPPASPPRQPQLYNGTAGSPSPARSPARSSIGRAGASSRPSVGPDCVWIVSLYGRVYCCHLDKALRVLRLYRMYRDTVVLMHEYEVFTDSLALSVVDSVLLAHDLHSGLVLLFDVLTPGAAPLAAPLPLGLPPVVGSGGGGSGAGGPLAHAHRAWAWAAGAEGEAPRPAPGAADAATGHHPLPPLLLCQPHWVLDPVSGSLCRLHLDLAAVVETGGGDWPMLVAFLQRREAGGRPGDPSSPLELTLQVVKGILQERVALSTAAQVFHAANLAYRDAARLAVGSAGSGSSSSRPTPGSLEEYPVVSPEVMAERVFGWLREEQVVDALYLQAVVGQYISSCHSFGTPIPPSLALLYVETFLDQEREHVVGPLLTSLPILDSIELAEWLEALCQQGLLREGRELALDMYRRLGAHSACCAALLRGGAVAGALRALQQHRVESLPPAAFLEAAASSGDPVLFAGVYRVCRERVKPFLPEFEAVRRQYCGAGQGSRGRGGDHDESSGGGGSAVQAS